MDGTAAFERMLENIVKRPAMYVGRNDYGMRDVGTFLEAYSMALDDVGASDPFDCFHRWVGLRFLISDSAWSWRRILVHVYGGDRAAIAALPELYREYRADRAKWDGQAMSAERDRRLIERYGRAHHRPESTQSEEPCLYAPWEKNPNDTNDC